MKKRIAAKPSSDEGHRRILDAARGQFAAFGFEGASLRVISAEAGVLHTAMLYHFNTKETLWRAVMTELFDDITGRYVKRTAKVGAAPPRKLARALVREFVHFCAERPELHRIMILEGRSDTPRLTWLVNNYVRAMFERFASVARSAGTSIADDPVRLYYATIGLAASTFTLAPEFKHLSGRNPFDPKEVAATAKLVERLIFGGDTGRGSQRTGNVRRGRS